MAKGVFITGTDTGCGKTQVTLGLMYRLQQAGEIILGMKPVASGASETSQGLRNEDALSIQRQGSFEVPYEKINPFVFAPAIAPHLAAAAAGRPIQMGRILNAFDQLTARADRVIVEGVGGWRVPLGPQLCLPDLVRVLDLPVLLVVGLRLGCLNHALLTQESIRHAGLELRGWIANQIDPEMQEPEANIAALANWLDAPCLGKIPYRESLSINWISQQLAAGGETMHLSWLFN
jgi:dethiobiotin synthetase